MTAWRAFLWAFTLDRFADMLWTTTLVWLATSADEPAAQGLIVAAALVPQAFVLLLGGATADRYGSVRVATVTTVAKAALLLVLIVAMELAAAGLVVLALVAALVGAIDGFHDPAIESWGARMKRPDEQRAAAATEATLWRFGQFGGSALGGLLLGKSAVMALTVTVGFYLLQRVFLWLMEARGTMDRRPCASSERPAAGKQIGGGLTFVRERPVLWATMPVQTVCTLTVGAVLMLLTPLLVREQGWPPVIYGVAAGCFGLGMFTGAGWVARRDEPDRGGVPFLAFGLAGAGHLALGAVAAAPDLLGPVGLTVGLTVFGLLLGPVGPFLSGYRRSITPSGQQGVGAAASRLIVQCPEPLGPLAAGVIVGVGDLRAGFVVCVGAGLLAAAAGAVGARQAERGITLR